MQFVGFFLVYISLLLDRINVQEEVVTGKHLQLTDYSMCSIFSIYPLSPDSQSSWVTSSRSRSVFSAGEVTTSPGFFGPTGTKQQAYILHRGCSQRIVSQSLTNIHTFIFKMWCCARLIGPFVVYNLFERQQQLGII